MIPSRYNVILNDEPNPGEALIFNTLHGGLFVLEPDYRRSLEKLAAGTELDPADHERLAEMAGEGFVAPGPEAERDQVSHRLGRAAYGGGETLAAKVLTTMACNLDCVYCFESKMERSPRLTPDAAARVVERLVSRVEETGAAKLAVDFYGGEPLLNPEAIEVVAGGLQAWCRENGRQFSCSLTTNGTLLTKAMVERLRPLGLTAARVSLDGVAALHDARRPFRNRQGSPHAAIMANLAEVADLVRVTATVTYSAPDLGPLAELLDDLEARGLLHRLATIQTGLEQQFLDGQGRVCGGENCALDANSAQLFLGMVGMLVDRGVHPRLDLLSATNCALCSESGPWLFAPDGGIHKCPMVMHQDHLRVGGLDQATLEPIYYRLITTESWRRCLDGDCPYLPLCGPGLGCRVDALKKTGDILGWNCAREFQEAYLPGAMRLEYRIQELFGE